jgi:hypothetical protein
MINDPYQVYQTYLSSTHQGKEISISINNNIISNGNSTMKNYQPYQNGSKLANYN